MILKLLLFGTLNLFMSFIDCCGFTTKFSLTATKVLNVKGTNSPAVNTTGLLILIIVINMQVVYSLFEPSHSLSHKALGTSLAFERKI